MRVYNERSGFELKAAFESAPGEPTVPASVHWRLRCATNDQTLQDWTEATYTIRTSDEGALAEVYSTIDVPGSINTILNRSNRREVKELQVVAAKDTDREYSQVHQYYVAQMSGGRS